MDKKDSHAPFPLISDTRCCSTLLLMLSCSTSPQITICPKHSHVWEFNEKNVYLFVTTKKNSKIPSNYYWWCCFQIKPTICMIHVANTTKGLQTFLIVMTEQSRIPIQQLDLPLLRNTTKSLEKKCHNKKQSRMPVQQILVSLLPAKTDHLYGLRRMNKKLAGSSGDISSIHFLN